MLTFMFQRKCNSTILSVSVSSLLPFISWWNGDTTCCLAVSLMWRAVYKKKKIITARILFHSFGPVFTFLVWLLTHSFGRLSGGSASVHRRVFVLCVFWRKKQREKVATFGSAATWPAAPSGHFGFCCNQRICAKKPLWLETNNIWPFDLLLFDLRGLVCACVCMHVLL